MNALRWLRENEPLQLVMWPTLGGIATILIAKGVIDADLASAIMAVAVAVLGGAGVVAARSVVTPDAHLPAAVAAVVNSVRGQVADQLGEPGIAALDHIDGMVQAAASMPQTGRHGQRRASP